MKNSFLYFILCFSGAVLLTTILFQFTTFGQSATVKEVNGEILISLHSGWGISTDLLKLKDNCWYRLGKEVIIENQITEVP